MKNIPFIKMQGAGNDFVFLDRAQVRLPVTAALAQKLLDRRLGIGGDQLLVLGKNPKKEFLLDIFNPDGSKAEMCGDAVRAVAYYLKTYKGIRRDFVIQTLAGPIGIGLKGRAIEVDMGQPILEGSRIPVKKSGEIVHFPLKVEGNEVRIHCVSMGNPHAVIFVKDVISFPVRELGPKIEHHPFFPRRVNVEFAQVINRTQVVARVWERGAGETLACGTGACAIAVAAARFNKTGRNVKIDLPGGRLGVRWAENNHLLMRGPAEVVYRGNFQI